MLYRLSYTPAVVAGLRQGLDEIKGLREGAVRRVLQFVLDRQNRAQ